MPPPVSPGATGKRPTQTVLKAVPVAQSSSVENSIEPIEIREGLLQGEIALGTRRKEKAFPFMRLLPELRVVVCELLLVKPAETFLSGYAFDPGVLCTIHHRANSNPDVVVVDHYTYLGPFGILQACETIQVEAMPILYGANRSRLHRVAKSKTLQSFLPVIIPGMGQIRIFTIDLLYRGRERYEDANLAHLPKLDKIYFAGVSVKGIRSAASSKDSPACGGYLAEQLKGFLLQVQANLRS